MAYKQKRNLFGVPVKTENDGKTFARKLIIVNVANLEEVDHEMKVLDWLRQTGGHENIIEILGYGRLQGINQKIYFIDMKLADLTLAEYIGYVFLGQKLPATNFVENFTPIFSQRNCSESERLQTVWAISHQIVTGLEFLHGHGYVHRDLKPQNGTMQLQLTLNSLVLYCRLESLWKLTDFGVTSVGMTTSKTTVYGRGTSGYRAPELCNPGRSYYSNRSDIWALGCIVYELATGRRAFENDWATIVYGTQPSSDLPISVSYQRSFWDQHVSETLRELLSKDPQARPNAADTSRLLLSYANINDLPTPNLLIDSSLHPTYTEWKQLLGTKTSNPERLFELANWFVRNDIPDTCAWLVKEALAARNPFGIDGSYSVMANPRGQFLRDNQHQLREMGERLMAWKEVDCALLVYNNLAKSLSATVKTSLFEAAVSADMFSIQCLLKLGADLNGKDKQGNTPMHSAAAGGHVDAIKLLAKMGADVDRANEMGDTPLYLAATKGQLDAMKSVVGLGADLTGIEKKILSCAAKDGDQEMVEWLVEEKGGVNEKVLNLEWALYFAAQRGRVELMKWLVEQKNVSVNAVLDGQSVLRQALVQREWEAVRWMIDRGADVTATKDDGSTILHVAVRKGDLDIVKLLVQRGADVTVKQIDGSMAMHLAAKGGNWEMVQWLVKHGSDVRAETKDGSTIWQLAPIQGRQEMVEWLMEHRNDPTVAEGKGEEMIQWLKNHGVYDYRKYPSSVVPRNSETTRLMRTGPSDGQWIIFAGYCSQYGYRSDQRKAS